MIPTEVDNFLEDRTQLAQDTLENLEIIKKCRTDPNLVEHTAYSHFTESQKKHSLTFTVSNKDVAIL
jgi:hypothetical protein